jgi:hypothetical protein
MANAWKAGGADDSRDGVCAPLILTLDLPPDLMAALGAIRAQCDPHRADRSPVHCSLFRHLPGPSAALLVRDIRAVAADTPRLPLAAAPIRFARGHLHAPILSTGADRFRARLAERWHGLLMPADAAPPRLHVTLGNRRAANAAANGRGMSIPTAMIRDRLARGVTLWQHAVPWVALVSIPFRL